MRRLTVDASEATYLAGLVGAEAIFGLTDPFVGWLADEIEQGLKEARDRLTQRGVLSVTAAGLTLDPGARDLLLDWVKADLSATAVVTPAGAEPSVRHYHEREGRALEQFTYPGMGMYELRELPHPDSVGAAIVDFLALEEQPAPGLASGVLQEPHLNAARKIAEGAGPLVAREALLEALLPPDVAEPLSRTLAEPVASASLVVFNRQAPRWSQQGVAFLRGLNGWWILQLAHQAVEVHPCTGAQISAAVVDLTQRHRRVGVKVPV